MKHLISSVLTLGAAVSFADPSVTVNRIVHDTDSGLVTVDYTLTDGPAIVTVDFTTNGVSIGRKMFRSVAGDVNKLISKTQGKLYWQPKPENGAYSCAAGVLSAKVTARRPDDPPAYMVVRLDLDKKRYYYESADELPFGVDDQRYRRDHLLMRRIPAAGCTFEMGSPEGEPDRVAASEVQHRVSFTNDYYMGVFEFTVAQYVRLGYDAGGRAADVPLSRIAYEASVRGWRDNGYRWPQDGHTVADWCLMDSLRRRTGVLFDFPTEAQWEFAARAGSTNALPCNLSSDAIDEVAWHSGNADGQAHGVGLKKANAWGLYDVLGNVREMCLDVWSEDNTVYGEIDPPGLETPDRVAFTARGGGYDLASSACRLASREGVMYYDTIQDSLGFRLWCPLPDETPAQ